MQNEDIKEQAFPNEQNQNNQDQNRKHSRGFFLLIIVVASIFISATTGGFFGFLAARANPGFISKIGSGKLDGLFSQKQASISPEIRQTIIQEDSAVIDVVKKTSPSVVSILITKDIAVAPDFFDPFGFFDQGPSGGNSDGSGTQKQEIGGGTGFFITADGMVVTNRHVVDDSSASYTVVTNDNEKHPAKVLAIDPVADIAVIKIEGSGFPTLELGNSSSVQVGQTVVAIGNSLGQFSNTVSRGIVSGLKRNLTAGGGVSQPEKLTNIIQTDAAINPGNSGGPLLDIDGRVIGINVAIASGAQNIGFAIPSNQVSTVIEQVKTTGRISTPFLGVRYIPVDEALQKKNNLPESYGDLIARGNSITDLAIVPGSPADKAGLIENDIILEFDGTKLDETNGQGLTEMISQHKVGDTVTLKVWRKGITLDVKVTLEERK